MHKFGAKETGYALAAIMREWRDPHRHDQWEMSSVEEDTQDSLEASSSSFSESFSSTDSLDESS